jgi:hypothetical protein
MQRCNPLAPSSDWLEIINEGCRKWKANTLEGVLCRLILRSTVYGIWRARDEIKHGGQPRTEELILKAIFWEVRSRISAKRSFKMNRENIRICHCWNIDTSLLL